MKTVTNKQRRRLYGAFGDLSSILNAPAPPQTAHVVPRRKSAPAAAARAPRTQSGGTAYESKTSAPVSFATSTMTGKAVTSMSPKGNVSVKHSSLIADVVSNGGAFELTAITLNPGLAAAFPWLSSQAALYQFYRVKNFNVRFISREGTGTTGSILTAFEYAAYDALPANEVSMAQYAGAVESNVWLNTTTRIDVRSAMQPEKWKYVRTSPSLYDDLKTMDFGRFLMALVGVPAGVVGKLWFDYEFEFHTPQLQGLAAPPAVAKRSYGAFVTGSPVVLAGTTVDVPFTTSFNSTAMALVGVNFSPAVGFYLVRFDLHLTAPAVSTPQVTVFLIKTDALTGLPSTVLSRVTDYSLFAGQTNMILSFQAVMGVQRSATGVVDSLRLNFTALSADVTIVGGSEDASSCVWIPI